jgi:hypothetical protein
MKMALSCSRRMELLRAKRVEGKKVQREEATTITQKLKLNKPQSAV